MRLERLKIKGLPQNSWVRMDEIQGVAVGLNLRSGSTKGAAPSPFTPRVAPKKRGARADARVKAEGARGTPKQCFLASPLANLVPWFSELRMVRELQTRKTP